MSLLAEEIYAFPASYAQRRLYFLETWMPGNPVYNIPMAVRIEGHLDVQRLEDSFQALIDRHETLRTTFETEDGETLQIVHPSLPFSLCLVDLQSVPSTEREDELQALAKKEARRPFDLANGPLLRVQLVSLTDVEHVLLVNMHHIVSDGWSMGVLLQELIHLYSGMLLPELPIQYADYAIWQQEHLQAETLQRDLDYWKSQLGGTLPLLQLPTDRPHPAEQTYDGAVKRFTLSETLAANLQELSRREGVSMYMVLLAAYKTLLFRSTGQQDLLVGSPVAGRNRSELESLIGVLINTLVLRTQLFGEMTFRELLAQVRNVTLDAYEHQDLPFEKMVEELNPNRSRSHSPLFQTMFVWQNAPMTALRLPGLTLTPLQVDTETAKFDLTLLMEAGETGLVGAFEYNTDLFDEQTIERMISHLSLLLAGIATNPDEKIADLPLLSEAQRQRVLVDWNETANDSYPVKCLQELFAQQVLSTPDRAAVTWDGGQMSYVELNRRANQLAHHLQKLGVGPDVGVGISMERTPEMVIGLLAILKAGGAYVPLDPAYPEERLRFMVEDAAVPVLLTQRTLVERLPETNARLLCLDNDWHLIAQEPETNPEHAATVDHLAYMIYTSGSTGRPKGVMVEHRGICNRLMWMQDAYRLTETDRVLQKTPFSFDVSVWEFFWPLLTGACLVLARPGGHQDAGYLANLIARERITTLHFVPSMLQVFLEQKNLADRCRSVRRVICSGEALPYDLQEKFFARMNEQTELHNLYGPTEASVDVTYWACERNSQRRLVPIGRPIANTQLYVLDSQRNPVPVGVTGELYIGGVGLARGYHNREELTRESFLPNPFDADASSRLYKTGDLARWLSDGVIEYAGRVDHQVKIRGFRIETGEIETVLASHPSVRETVVVAQDDRLVAYVVPDAEPASSELRDFLHTKLPEHMVPSLFMFLDALPLSPSGKCDRKALPVPTGSTQEMETAYVAPLTMEEERTAAIWQELLGVERVGVHDNFFELGGHSILAIRLLARLQEVFGWDVPMRTLFQNPTVEGLVTAANQEGVGQAIVRVARDQELFPLSSAQQRLWFLDQLEPGDDAYHIPSAVRLRGMVNEEALVQSIHTIVMRHEALRTQIVAVDGVPMQKVLDTPDLDFQILDLTDATDPEAQMQEVLRAESRRPFTWGKGSLFRARLLRMRDVESVLFVNMHHIIADGWSHGIFIRELAAFYDSLVRGEEPQDSEVPVHYVDYAIWQQEQLESGVLAEELTYWKKQLGGTLPRLELPTDRLANENDSASQAAETGSQQTLLLTAPQANAVRKLGQQHGATLFMTMTAAFQALLHRLTGQEDIIVGTPVAGRQRPETEGMIGLLLNTLALRTELSGQPTFSELLNRVRNVAMEAFSHQELPFEKLVGEIQPERSLHRNPIFDVMINHVNTPHTVFELTGLQVEPMELGAGTAKFLLTMYIEEQGEDITLRLAYSNTHYSDARMREMLHQLQTLLEQAVTAPERSIRSYSLVTPEASEVVPDPSEPLEKQHHDPVHELVSQWAEQLPTQIAVIQGTKEYRYAELVTSAKVIADQLRTNGIQPGNVVAIHGPRSFEAIASMLGTWMSGGVILPLDSNLPPHRRNRMVQEAGAKYHISYMEVEVNQKKPAQITSVNKEHSAQEPLNNLTSDTTADTPAYIFFTSGTTGVPKGVLGTHAGLSHFLQWQRETFAVGPQDRCGQLTGLSFDVVLRDIFLPLTSGATLCLPPDPDDLSGDRILPWLESEGITLLHTVPSLAQSWLSSVSSGRLNTTLRLAFFAGEPLTDTLVRRWRARFSAVDVINLYGPTETTLAKCFSRVASKPLLGSQPVGAALPQAQALILSEQGQRCGIGEPGEIVIRTPYRTLGYINASDEMKKRFGPNPFRSDSADLLYRTGDRGRYRPDGTVEILGRLDDEVKIRGVRIQLADVAATLIQHPAVDQCAVLDLLDEQGQKYLAAYVVPVPNGHEAPVPESLRVFLEQRLLSSMVPTAYVILDHLPLTPNGKVDRKALPLPERKSTEPHDRLAPRTDTEVKLAQLWADVLGIASETLSVTDDFFTRGGHSLLAMQLISRIRQTFAVEFPLRSLFESSVLAAQAQQVDATLHVQTRTNPVPIVPVPRSTDLELSYAQQRMWFLHQLEPNNSAYHIPVAFRIEGTLSPVILEKSLQTLVKRHETLRTTFHSIEGRPVQVVADAGSIPLRQVDLRGVVQGEREAEAQSLLVEETRRPFDLSEGPLVRALLVQTGEEAFVLLITLHHIISDAWSVGILIEDLIDEYLHDGRSPLPDLPIQYADFAAWQRNRLSGEAYAELLSYWKKQFTGELPTLRMPTARPRPSVQSYKGAQKTFSVPAHVVAPLQELSRQEGATLFMTLLAAFKTLLYRHSGQEDLIVGTPVAGRTRVETERLIGFFVNTLALRTDLSGQPSFRELVRRVRDVALDGYAHQDLPYERMLEDLQLTRDRSRNALFQVMFILQNAPTGAVQVEDTEFLPLNVDRGAAKFDLTFALVETAEGLVGEVEYNTDLYDADAIEAILTHYQTLLESIACNPDTEIAVLPMLPEQEQRRLLVEWNDTSVPVEPTTIHQQFEQQVRANPDRVAAVFEGDEITYRELNAQAESIRERLQQQRVGPGTLVGLCMERSLTMLAALIGIHKAGGAYVPLDPSYPVERLSYMVQDSQMPVLLTDGTFSFELPNEVEVQLLTLPKGSMVGDDEPNPTISEGASARPDDLAYVIYTSGSTGKPKGVEITHSNVIHFFHGLDERIGEIRDEVMLAVTGIGFDISVLELFWSLTRGCKVVLLDRQRAIQSAAQTSSSDVYSLPEQIARHHVTMFQCTPSLMKMLLANASTADAVRRLRVVMLGGEAMPVALAKQWKHDYPHIRLLNMYGPTEATVWATTFEVEEVDQTVPIGRPLANCETYVLDEHLQPLPIGVPGELYIGGLGLARGYFNRLELTQERFLEHRFEVNPRRTVRLYKTGDLVRYAPNGTLECLGRTDHQVKIRGHRIELGEIEEVLNQHPTVRQAAVTVQSDAGGELRLVAYVVLEEHRLTESWKFPLQSFLREQVPENMMPSFFVSLESMPLTPNGKIDRRMLPEPNEIRDVGHDFIPPRDPFEFEVVQIWEEVLGIRPIGVTDNFFTLGGHSMLAVRLLAQLQNRFQQNLPIATLFQGGTVEHVAAVLRGEVTQRESTPLVEFRTAGEARPFFCVHPGFGNTLCYIELADRIAHHVPFYGLQALGLDDDREPIQDMKEMASRYLQAVRSVQPHGPYQLGGWSMGGVVAYEMAQQLRQAGEKVDLLLLIDSLVTMDRDHVKAVSEVEFALLSVEVLSSEQDKQVELPRETLLQMEPQAALLELLELAQVNGLLPPDLGLLQFRRLLNVLKANNHAYHKYVPQEYEGSVVFLKAQEQDEAYDDPTMGWGGLALGGVTVYEVPGHHNNMVRPPHVESLANRINLCLNQTAVGRKGE